MSASKPVRSLRRSVDRVLEQLVSLAVLAGDKELLALCAPSVSNWAVGEQIEHLRRSDLTILSAISSLDMNGPSNGSPSFAGRLVLLSGFIPRGRGRAPGATVPLEVNPLSLPQGLQEVRAGFVALLPDLGRLSRSRATIKHPVLGRFTVSQMIAFAGIHHHHHQKIIKDIRRVATASQ
jgi:hypothetical protein